MSGSNQNENYLKRSLHLSCQNSLDKTGHHSIVCLVTKADKSVTSITVSSKDSGYAVLIKICESLGLMEEREYFGLTYDGPKKELLWINLKNKLSKQLSGSSPYQLTLRVKYFIPPSDLIMEYTKKLFFLDIDDHLKNGVWGEVADEDLLSRIIALQTHVHFGRYDPVTTPCKYAISWPHNMQEMPVNFIRKTASYHRMLEHTSPELARYQLMNLVWENVPYYGCHLYKAKDIFKKKMNLFVGPKFIFISDENCKLLSKHPYSAVSSITLATKVININFFDDSGAVKARLFELATQRVAQSLYRCITEMNAFFLTDSISPELINQTASHLKDSLGFLFDQHQKEFIFDVSYTAREVLDNTRRQIHQGIVMATQQTNGNSNTQQETLASSTEKQVSSLINIPQSAFVREVGDVSLKECSHSWSNDEKNFSPSFPSGSVNSVNNTRYKSDSDGSNSTVTVNEKELDEIVQARLRQAHLCMICCNDSIERVFLPCGHALCCEKCSNHLEQCPMCRSRIDIRHPVFFPTIPTEYSQPNHDSTNFPSPLMTLKGSLKTQTQENDANVGQSSNGDS